MKKTLLTLMIAALSTLVLAACASTGAAQATPVAAAQPAGLIAEGRLVPLNTLEQSFSTAGQVAEVLVNDGDSVKAGERLARLSDSPDAELALARAEQEVAAAQQALVDLIADGELNLAQARQALLKAEEDADAAQEALDGDDTEENQAQADIAAALLIQARLRLQDLQDNQGVVPALLDAANNRLNVAEKAQVAAQAALDARTLKATTDGTVVDLAAQPGQRVAAGQALLSLADFSGWLVKTDNLTEVEVVNVKVGQSVQVIFDALPETELSGEVTKIESRFEEKRGDITYTVTIKLTQTDPQLRWGMTAAVVFDR
ncbi:MAG TPA: HlyD family efflux transporter periplasmic adaptor subunit [Anaerolineaceae bacterium]